ncbi:aliphatic sulfonate ABC transporter substrate-binding protein [Aquabacterium sp.]|uniref:aliphatic sulfonate ABC transporter substrate-binding protein n=1 Tax=Aquabacterium sp. TaxID=1872578 RepID=UPI002CDC6C83|nr:aliphatic sulfonate ABC transporter substrate-binding protein [Aquabacterium sp.]HSW04193.1 aliphatic sulfonate ABC transporter substrate-binding protein [Aquabacterium sp.]
MSRLTRRRALQLLAATGAASASSFSQAQAPTELRIGFQKGSFNLVVAKSLALVEKRLPGVAVKWVEFPAGPQLLEALAIGSVDFGGVGDSPPVFAQAAGKDLFYVGAEPAKPDSSAILVKPEAALKTLADLRGKRIAAQKGSSAHFLLVQALAKGGVAWNEVSPVYLPPADARAAFEKGAVDAWAIWDPYYAAAEIAGGVRVLATSRGLTNNNTFYLAGRGLTQREPQLRQLFTALTEADAYVQSQRKPAAQLFADFAGLGLATVHRVLERRQPSPVGPLTPALVAEQQRVADAFAQLGLIPKPIRVADIVWQPGAARVAQAVR